MWRKLILSICILAVCLTWGYADRVFSEEHLKKVLVIQSYHLEYEWVSIVSRGIKRVFDFKDDVQVETIYMDTKRNDSISWRERAGRKAREIVDLWNPDVIITVDDNAQEYVGRHYVGKGKTDIVFCGVNKTAADYGYVDAPNVCGILERPHFAQTVEFFREINPDVGTIAVISDKSSTSEGAISYMKAEAAKIQGIEFIGFDMPETFEHWKELVYQYEKKVDAIIVYTYHRLKDEANESTIPSRTVMRWMRRNSSVPVLGLLSFSVDDGAMLGVLESALEHGKEAALMADAILRGKNARDFRVRTADEGIVAVDMVQMSERGLTLGKKLKDKIDIILGE